MAKILDMLYLIDQLLDYVVNELNQWVSSGSTRLKEFLYVALIAFVSLLLAGAPYILVYRPPLVFPASNAMGLTFIDPDSYGEGVLECFIVAALYFSGLYGMKFLYDRLDKITPSNKSEVALVFISVILVVGLLYLISTWK
ncbi:MAG: hypothetical protein QXS21_03985 [Thermoproteota archaeon]|nr:hypothetical protein [Candidatus Brockarchaeota archaeon]MBO3762824.1 hypothetical protein [Candidatus Brockarchaeota archaeon]MBO3768011.1 hypothetical protein [Candidatus Brockarchaeota archaeon]MBO3801681.1 hypothetical protein [Candidatus Brockarchaeota archaeon]